MYEIFHQLCISRGITSADVCKATGISQSTISNWKKRGNLLSPALLRKIAEYFDLSIDYFFDSNFVPNKSDHQDPRADLDASADLKRDLLKYFDAFPAELQRSLVDLAKAYALQRQSPSKDQDPHSQSAE